MVLPFSGETRSPSGRGTKGQKRPLKGDLFDYLCDTVFLKRGDDPSEERRLPYRYGDRLRGERKRYPVPTSVPI